VPLVTQQPVGRRLSLCRMVSRIGAATRFRPHGRPARRALSRCSLRRPPKQAGESFCPADDQDHLVDPAHHRGAAQLVETVAAIINVLSPVQIAYAARQHLFITAVTPAYSYAKSVRVWRAPRPRRGARLARMPRPYWAPRSQCRTKRLQKNDAVLLTPPGPRSS
jgi:hypothetical protein